jgi:hypothetical protein
MLVSTWREMVGSLGVSIGGGCVFITYDFNDKQLLAYLLMAIGEHVVAVKAAAVFATLLCDL